MKTKNRKLWLVILVLMLATLACSIPGVTSSFTLTPEVEEQVTEIVEEVPEQKDQAPPPMVAIPDEVLLQDRLVQLYETVSPGVVSIQVYST